MMEEDASKNVLDTLNKEQSLEESWDMIIKMGLLYNERMESKAV